MFCRDNSVKYAHLRSTSWTRMHPFGLHIGSLWRHRSPEVSRDGAHFSRSAHIWCPEMDTFGVSARPGSWDLVTSLVITRVTPEGDPQMDPLRSTSGALLVAPGRPRSTPSPCKGDKGALLCPGCSHLGGSPEPSQRSQIGCSDLDMPKVQKLDTAISAFQADSRTFCPKRSQFHPIWGLRDPIWDPIWGSLGGPEPS